MVIFLLIYALVGFHVRQEQTIVTNNIISHHIYNIYIRKYSDVRTCRLPYSTGADYRLYSHMALQGCLLHQSGGETPHWSC